MPIINSAEDIKDNHYLKKELYDLVKADNTIFDFIQESSLDSVLK